MYPTSFAMSTSTGLGHAPGYGKKKACCDSCAQGGPCDGCGKTGGCNCEPSPEPAPRPPEHDHWPLAESCLDCMAVGYPDGCVPPSLTPEPKSHLRCNTCGWEGLGATPPVPNPPTSGGMSTGTAIAVATLGVTAIGVLGGILWEVHKSHEARTARANGCHASDCYGVHTHGTAPAMMNPARWPYHPSQRYYFIPDPGHGESRIGPFPSVKTALAYAKQLGIAGRVVKGEHARETSYARENPMSDLKMEPGYAYKWSRGRWDTVVVSDDVTDRAVFTGYRDVDGSRVGVFKCGRSHYAQLVQNLRSRAQANPTAAEIVPWLIGGTVLVAGGVAIAMSKPAAPTTTTTPPATTLAQAAAALKAYANLCDQSATAKTLVTTFQTLYNVTATTKLTVTGLYDAPTAAALQSVLGTSVVAPFACSGAGTTGGTTVTQAFTQGHRYQSIFSTAAGTFSTLPTQAAVQAALDAVLGAGNAVVASFETPPNDPTKSELTTFFDYVGPSTTTSWTLNAGDSESIIDLGPTSTGAVPTISPDPSIGYTAGTPFTVNFPAGTFPDPFTPVAVSGNATLSPNGVSGTYSGGGATVTVSWYENANDQRNSSNEQTTTFALTDGGGGTGSVTLDVSYILNNSDVINPLAQALSVGQGLTISNDYSQTGDPLTFTVDDSSIISSGGLGSPVAYGGSIPFNTYKAGTTRVTFSDQNGTYAGAVQVTVS